MTGTGSRGTPRGGRRCNFFFLTLNNWLLLAGWGGGQLSKKTNPLRLPAPASPPPTPFPFPRQLIFIHEGEVRESSLPRRGGRCQTCMSENAQ